MLTQDQKSELIGQLDAKFKISGHPLKCPMCSNAGFTIADGYFNNPLQDNLTTISLGGTTIPTIGIVCSNCGFLSQHALGVIGMLPKNDDEANK